MPANLEPTMYPLIWDGIITASDLSTVLALRATSRRLGEEVNRHLHAHLVTTGHHSISRMKEEKHVLSCLILGFLYSQWGDATARVRLPDHTWGKMVVLLCGRMDIGSNVSEGDLRQLGSLVQPKTLRIPPAIARQNPLLAARGGLVLQMFEARTMIVSLAHDENSAAPGLLSSIALRPCTQRLVLHQHCDGWGGVHLLLRSPSLFELVLVFHPGFCSIGRITDYLKGLVDQLPRTAITVVGLEEALPRPIDSAELSTGFKNAALEFRTRAEHKRNLRAAQWEAEMEL